MRDIQFRGKRKDNGCWVYGNLIMIRGRAHINAVNRTGIVEPDTVGEYTGHDDITGKRIFEGDIIRYANGIGSIVWSEPNAAFMCREEDGEYHEWFSLLENIEVIGNIHESEGKAE